MNYGIRVKNPLPNPVRVEVIDGDRIIHSAIVPANGDSAMVLKNKGEYEVRTTILHRVKGAIDEELGSGGFLVTGHKDAQGADPGQVDIPASPVFLSKTAELNFRFWRDIITWKVNPGIIGEIRSVEISEVEGVGWRLKVMKQGDGRGGGTIMSLTSSTQFDDFPVTGGFIVKVQASSRSGQKVSVSARLSALETPVGDGMPHVEAEIPAAKLKPRPVEQEEEVDIRSMADMFDDMRKREVLV